MRIGKCLTICGLAGLLVMDGCAAGVGVATTGKNVQGDNAALPNPSTRKCLEDGYEIETVEVHGVPSVQYCVDRKTGLKCEAWAYFRGECRFGRPKSE
jgi:putative hemolysin